MTILRMVRPMRRKGSRSGQFRQRIPLDVRDKVRGLTLAVPIGPHTVQKHIGPHAAEITISLRTHDDSEVRQRQAAVIAYLENVYKALRMDAPSAITHKDAWPAPRSDARHQVRVRPLLASA